MDSRKRFSALETMCRERAQLAKREFESRANNLRTESASNARNYCHFFPVVTPCEPQDGSDTHAQITSGDGAHAANRSYFASISDARSKSISARCRGQRRSDRSKGRSWLGSRARWLSSVWLEPRAQGGLARPWVPARSLEKGQVLSPTHHLRRSISRMDQGIALERDDFLRIVITFGTNALYGRSVDFVNTWGSAAVWVS